ncbi:MAG: Ig-like domain repeat protein [Lachnospiraceae bacterium]|nr:Ig-like domain repeat protein [Lachnospiraceae bacterium]
MRKERDRIVAWLLTFVMVFLMAVGSGRVIFADGEDAVADVIAEEAAESSEDNAENAEIAESGVEPGAETESGETDETTDGSEGTEPEEIVPEENVIPLDVTVTVKDKQYDGTINGEWETMTVSVVEETGETFSRDITSLTENPAEYIEVNEITFVQADAGSDLAVTYTLSWTEAARAAGYDEICALPETTDGTYFTTASITAREVVIESIRLADRLYDGTTIVDIDTAEENRAVVALRDPSDTDAGMLTEQVESLYLTGTVEIDSKDVGDTGKRTAVAFGTKADGETADVSLATDTAETVDVNNFVLAAVDPDGTVLEDINDYFQYNTVQVTISRAVIWLSFSALTCEYQAVPDDITDCEVSVSWPSAAGGSVEVSIRDYTFGGSATEALKEEAQAVLDAYEKPELVLLKSELDEDGDGFNPGLDVGVYENVVGLSGLTVAEEDLSKNTENSFLNVNVTVEGTTNSNYQLRVAEADDFGDIIIEQDSTTYSLANLDVKPGENVFVDEVHDTVYVKQGTVLFVEGNEALSESLKSELYSGEAVYDSVWIGTTEDSGKVTLSENLTTGVSAEELAALSSDSTLTLYLAKTVTNAEGEVTGAKNYSRGFAITIHNDGTAPAASFAVSGNILENQTFADRVTFGLIDHRTMSFNLTVEDAESGIACIETYLYTGSKEEIDALDGQGNNLRILSEDWEWDEVMSPESNDGRSEGYTVSAAYTVKANIYAVAFARVTDRVGNVCIYGSNGLIVEVNAPNIPVITYSIEGKSDDGVYGGDVCVTIRASEMLADADDIASGLQSVTYTIYKDGEAVSGYTDVELFEDTLEEAIAEGTVTLEQLQSAVSMNLERDITIPASVFDSNNVYVAVRVTDQAGNIGEAVGDVIQIDVTNPAVEVSYDNNSAANTRYFKRARTATIVYTERNFDIEQVTFDLTLADGEKQTLSFRELNAIEGIRTSYTASEDDSQYGCSQRDYTDARTNTVTITFSGDNDYTIVPHAIDLAGNEAEEAVYASSTARGTKTHFIIDTTAPVLSIVYYDAEGKEITPGKSEKKRLYEDGTIYAAATIIEHNFAEQSGFAKGQIVYAVTAADAGGSAVTVMDYQSMANTLSGWTANADVWTSARFTFSADANYVAGFTYTDLAGNSVIWKNDYYTVDQTAPTGTVSVGSLGTWVSFPGKITFSLFSRKSQRVRITADDATSPVQSISYLTATGRMTKAQLAASDKWKKYSSFVRKANRQFIVYARLVDEAGNVAYLSSEGVVLDTTAPGPEITITMDDAGNGIYNGDVPFTVQVTDPTRGGTYAGLQSVSYEILCDGVVTQSGNFDAELTPASRRVQSLTKRLTVNAKKNNSNDVMIRVTAVDNAGNTAAAKQALKIDITKPTISVTYNDVFAVNGTYYQDTRVATVTVTERNFDASGVHFSITNTDGTQPAISGWSHSADSGTSDGATHTCTVTFSADGDYTFTVEATDRAENTGSYGQTDRFTVDRTAPVLSVSYDNNDVTGGSYYNAVRTATVAIREHNFDASAVTAAITASLNGQGLTAPVLSAFHSEGDVHTATISYTADADYTFTISCMDRAGNHAAAYETERFTVDTRKPEITIGNVAKANTGAVQPTVEVTDQNYVGTQVTITLTGAHNGEMELSTSVVSISQGQKFTLVDLAHEQDLDDIYTLQVTAADRAGNTARENYTFSVNRYGSVYTLDDRTAELLEPYYMSEPADLVIRETNPDRLNDRWIVCMKDGEKYTLEEGLHYTVNVRGGDGSWWVYEYTISRENFTEDGIYTLTLYSEDGASNVSSNQAKGMDLEFVVDTTPPNIVITGVTDRGQYTRDAQDITVDAQDNIYLAALKLEVLDGDGSVLEEKEYTEEELRENDGAVSYELVSRSVWQTVRVTATDAVGNRAVSEDITVLINPSRLLQYYMNKPLFYGSLLVLCLIAALIVCYVRRKRRQGR